jgi:hypothetical protein
MKEEKFDLGKILKRIGMLKRDFAKQCGVHHVTVSRWCNGWVPISKYAEVMFTMEVEGINIVTKNIEIC